MLRARRFPAVVSIVALAGAVVGAQRPPVETIVTRASQYVARFVTQFTSVVAEEQYTQRIDRMNGETRILTADFMLVKIGAAWMPFRDVYSVNGSVLRDHADRLITLFLERPAEAAEQAALITRESYRYNLGFERSVNNPLLTLVLLQDLYRGRFVFALAGEERISGTRVWVVRYEERARPTIVRTRNGGNLAAHGRYWIDQTDGTVLRTELLLDDQSQKTRVLTTFERDDRFQVAVPVRMEESYVPGTGSRTLAEARYGRFRRFEVKTEEALKTPLATDP